MADPKAADRWARRPAIARSVRVLAWLAPVLAGVASAAVVARLLPPAGSVAALVTQGTLVVAMSLAAAFLVDRAARRLLPLAFLLDLSLLFPDRAPSRFGVALRAGSTRELVRQQDTPPAGEPVEAAERILALTSAMSLHDRHTRGHSERVRAYAELIGEEMGLEDEDLERLRWAALLHDVGKLSVPTRVLNKDEEPDPEEWDVLHRHPEEGARLAAPLLPWLGEWGEAIAQHHERFDGHGYPEGLRGEEISLSARIVAVADAYETMVSPRPYKPAIAHAEARRELARCAGSDFDPAVVRAFLNVSTARLTALTAPSVALLDLPFLRQLGASAQLQAAGAATVIASLAVAASVLPPPTLGPPSSVAAADDAPEVPVPQEPDDAPPSTSQTTPDDEPSPLATEPPDPADVQPARIVSRPAGSARTGGATSGTDAGAGSAGGEQAVSAEEPATSTTTPPPDGPATSTPDEPAASPSDETTTPPPDDPEGAPDGAEEPEEEPEEGEGTRTGEDRWVSQPDTPPHASADPDPDTEPGDGASPAPREP